MSDVNYTSLHEIRQEAGIIKKLTDTRVAGVVDGSNRTFYTNNSPIIDRNGDDEVTTADVTAFVNDIPVIVQAVDPATGAVTLASAPAIGTKVLIAYEFSALDDAEVAKRRKTAQDWLNGRVASVYNLAVVTITNYPPVWADVIRLYAGGLLQVSDYGANADTDGSSKDGYKKIGLAEKMLGDWISTIGGGTDGSDPNAKTRTGSFSSDGDFVGRRRGGIYQGHDREREFWNKI